MNLCNLIQLKMTFIKLHYFLEHKLLVLSPQGICTWIVLSVSVHLPLAIIPWAPSLQGPGMFLHHWNHVGLMFLLAGTHHRKSKHREESQNPPGWERHRTSSLPSWAECYLHLPVAATYFNVTLTHQA